MSPTTAGGRDEARWASIGLDGDRVNSRRDEPLGPLPSRHRSSTSWSVRSGARASGASASGPYTSSAPSADAVAAPS